MMFAPLTVFMVLLSTLCSASRWGAFCPAHCQCNDTNLTANCAKGKFEVVPLTLNPMIKEIYLPNNNISNVDSIFEVYTYVEVINLSHNLISNLSSKGLELEYLKVLDLNYNEISIIERDAFSGLKSLTHLSLKKNSITELPSNLFSPMPELRVLDLSHNKISSLNVNSFHGLNKLEKLTLHKNALRFVPSDSFIHLSVLKSLDLGANALSMIDANAFEHLAKLEELSLDQCTLSQINVEAFDNNLRLRKLNLQDNSLRIFPRAVSSLPDLEELNIGGNLMSKIAVSDLKHLRKLKRLHLTRANYLERIEEDVFRHTPELEELWMEFNQQLEHLPSALLGHLRQLRKVSLRGNNLKYIHPELLPLEQLESFDVSRNPLVCNCSLAWLWHHMAHRPHEYHNSSAVRCHGPTHIHMEFLKNLDNGQLECRSESGKGVLAVTLTSVLVLCLVSVVLFMAWRRRITDARTGTIIKDLDFSPVNYASYDNHKYPYIIQPFTTLGKPISGQSNQIPEPPYYATLNPNALQSYLMSLNSAMPAADTNNRAYQTLSCHNAQLMMSRTPSEPSYETIGREQTHHSLIYV